MSELRGIYSLWFREIKRYLRERTRIISSFVQPLLWLVIFGAGLGSVMPSSAGFSYQEFIFPGIICQTLLFTSMFMGISVIWDRQFGFLKEILVAPISRVSIFIGKMLGVSTDSMIQGTIVLMLGFLIGVSINLQMVIVAIPLMLLITLGLVCIGLTLASFMDSLESFGTIMTFVNLPMFLLSGALFPVNNLPSWLQWVVYIDPLTYDVDALRTVILGSAYVSLFPFYIDMIVIMVFDAVMIFVGTYAFSLRK
ncbi:MAG: ABC transporter permease [Methanotrichaceae archaeon]|nr:ABC transporter permease [Methanotrichaceae archaeon]